MNPDFSTIQEGLDAANVPMTDRSAVVAVGFARAIAFQLALPAEPQANPMAYFDQTLSDSVATALAQVNERYVLNFNQTLQLVCQLWLFRYRMVFEATNPDVIQCVDLAAQAGSRALAPTTAPLLAQSQEVPAFESLMQTIGSAFLGKV